MKKLQQKILFLLFSVPIFGYAQGYQVNLQGQVQQGMGSAGTAYMKDAAALFFNPGGVSFLTSRSINVGVSSTFAKSTFLDKNTNQVANTNSPSSYPFAIYGVCGANDSSKLKYGLAIYTPFGSTIRWEDEWMGRFALTQLQLQAIFFQPTLSYKVNDKIGVGAGFVYAMGKVNLQKDIPVSDMNGNYGHAELDGKANGFGFNAGVYIKPIEELSIGITYRSQVNMNVKNGEATFTVPSSLSANFPNGKFTSSLPLPQVLTLGLASALNKKLTLAFDLNFVGWNAYDTLAFDYENNTSTLGDTKSARKYENAFSARLGGEYMATNDLAVRLGIAYGISPVQDGYVTPETPDANRIIYTAGLGYTFGNRFGVNASFYFSSFKREDTNLETGLSGTYKTNVCVPGIALFYKF
ncbi:MAG TPA: outer membrane protein transport protein [Bacteroidia bacterium]|nr:outer membrane protein transport protein [Bacteroidia bacterium]